MDPNVPFQVYSQTAQSFIQHLTFVCTIVIALATLTSLVFTVITAIIGSSVYKLNKDLREEHAGIKENIRENILILRQLKVEYKIQMERAKDTIYRINTDPILLSEREFIDSVITSLEAGQSEFGDQTAKIISGMYNLSELGDMADMKRLVKVNRLASEKNLQDITFNATRALMRIAEKQ